MAQNITLMGATYNDVPAVELPKSGGGVASFTDVTDTTAGASDVASGKYFYTSAGVRTAGTGTGGGGVTGSATEVSIATSEWSSHACPKTVSGVTADNIIIVSPAPTSRHKYIEADVRCASQAIDTLTFECTTDPNINITVNVLILDGVTIMTPTLYQITNAFADVSIVAEAAENESVTATNIGSQQIKMMIKAGDVIIAQNDEYVGNGGTLTFTMPASNVAVNVIVKPR